MSHTPSTPGALPPGGSSIFGRLFGGALQNFAELNEAYPSPVTQALAAIARDAQRAVSARGLPEVPHSPPPSPTQSIVEPRPSAAAPARRPSADAPTPAAIVDRAPPARTEPAAVAPDRIEHAVVEPREEAPAAPAIGEISTQCIGMGNFVGIIRTLKNELDKTHRGEPVTNAVVEGAISRIFEFNPGLRAALAETVRQGLGSELTADSIESFLKAHSGVLLTIVNNDGISLIDTLLHKYEQTLSLLNSLKALIDLENTIHTNPSSGFIGHIAIEKFNSLPGEQRGILAYLAWERNGKTIDGRVLIQNDPKILVLTTADQPISILRGEILKAQKATAQAMATIQLEICQRHAEESDRLFRLKLNVLQIEKLKELLTTSGSRKEDILQIFRALPKDVKDYVCELVWRLDGEPKGDSHFGVHTIERHPHIFLHILNSEGKNLLEQLSDHFQEQLKAQAMKEHAEKLQTMLAQTPVDKDAFARYLERFSSVSETSSDMGLNAWNMAGKTLATSFGGLVWERDRIAAGQADNPNFGGWGYGDRVLRENPATLIESTEGNPSILQSFLNSAEARLAIDLVGSMRDPSRYTTGVEKIAGKVEAAAAPRVAMISAEFSGILSQGGLGAAVRGMAEGLGGRNVTVIMPKYDNSVLPPAVASSMKRTEYTVNGHAVWEANVGEITALLIENDSLFTIGTHEGKANSVYAGPDPHIKARFAHFQNDAAELSLKLYQEKKIDVVHIHDAQAGLVPKILAHRYSDAWKRGETPAVVFTFHNNLSQENYNYDATVASLDYIGLGRDHRSGFHEALDVADAVTTVSGKFANEARSDGVLGRGAGAKVRKTALDGKFFDVLNGNTPGWDPKTNATLKDWTMVSTLENTGPEAKIEFNDFPTGASNEDIQNYINLKRAEIEQAIDEGQKVKVDLTYGHEDHPLLIAFKKILCKEQVAEYFEKFGLGTIDPNKPLLLNIGRFDPLQKGIDKVPDIMEAAKESGAQFISIGLDGKECPAAMGRLHAASRPHEGLIVIEDERVGGKIKWQQGHTREDGVVVPGIGPLLRAGADIAIFPSEFEPCGLVQGESFLFGSRVIATDTGGFHDTIFDSAHGAEPAKVNGWLFDRKDDWHGAEQRTAMRDTVTRALTEVKAAIYTQGADSTERTIAFYEQSKNIMRDAKNSSWTSTPDGSLTPVQKLQNVYTFAQARAKRRGHMHYDIRNPSVIV